MDKLIVSVGSGKRSLTGVIVNVTVVTPEPTVIVPLALTNGEGLPVESVTL